MPDHKRADSVLKETGKAVLSPISVEVCRFTSLNRHVFPPGRVRPETIRAASPGNAVLAVRCNLPHFPRRSHSGSCCYSSSNLKEEKTDFKKQHRQKIDKSGFLSVFRKYLSMSRKGY